MAVGQQRGAGLYVGPHESFERGRAIVRYHGEADATGTRIEIFRVLASWPGLIGVAIDHLDGPDDEDLASIAGLEECVALAEGDFRLIDFNDPLERFSVWVDHRSPQLFATVAFVSVCPAPQRGRAGVAASGTNESIRPATFEQEGRAARPPDFDHG